MSVTFATNSREAALVIAKAQSEGSRHRYVFSSPDGLFHVRDDAPSEPGYVILAGACNGSLVEVPPR
jgi:hypothetical protein